ncbi:MAG: 4Fe-4S binding protein [Candidatus Saccharicenans sp.]|jgi:Pyruvate/2-oxoacid:ferredoxin oxidoreductase delta subunit|nr:4Fe-4S binding protein [Candidatus Saccharicenans sp.]MDH7575089.1 4Fe-4S binding protein [Candidatus Saccharicenans sp.]
MCNFCHQHGEGKKWYLEARNYSEDLLSDLKRRRFIEHFFTHGPDSLKKSEQQLQLLDRLPALLRGFIRKKVTKRQIPYHFGQVIPIEDVEKILEMTTSVVRLACICRQTFLGSEQRFCYGLTLSPQGKGMANILKEIDASYLIGPQTGGLEYLTKEEALEHMRQRELDGLCHSLWTFITPFIGGLCNCSLPGCMAMRTTVVHKTPVMFRGEYLAVVDQEKCIACGECRKICPFEAYLPGKNGNKAEVDIRKCYGCGICRSVCAAEAISLVDRQSVPEVAQLWL